MNTNLINEIIDDVKNNLTIIIFILVSIVLVKLLTHNCHKKNKDELKPFVSVLYFTNVVLSVISN